MDGKFSTQREDFLRFAKGLDRSELKDKIREYATWFSTVVAILAVVIYLAPEKKTASTTDTPGNNSVPDSVVVLGFAKDFIKLYMESKDGEQEKLAPYITKKDIPLPATASSFTGESWEGIKQHIVDPSGLSIWWVEVSGFVNAELTLEPVRTYYYVPVAVFGQVARAIDVPRQDGPPRIGVDVKMDYRNRVDPDSPLGQKASGFVTAYLTGGDLTLYTAREFTGKPIIPALYRVDGIGKFEDKDITSNVSANGAKATTAEVRVQVHARDSNNANLVREYAYYLALRLVENRWQVTSLNKVPRLQLSTSDPNASTTAPTTTTSSTPPPPPTRN